MSKQLWRDTGGHWPCITAFISSCRLLVWQVCASSLPPDPSQESWSYSQWHNHNLHIYDIISTCVCLCHMAYFTDKETIWQTRVHPEASIEYYLSPISLIPKHRLRSAWTPSSRYVKTHARSCSKTCRNQTTNSTTSCPISKTHHTACGPTSATPDQEQTLTDTKTAPPFALSHWQ